MTILCEAKLNYMNKWKQHIGSIIPSMMTAYLFIGVEQDKKKVIIICFAHQEVHGQKIRWERIFGVQKLDGGHKAWSLPSSMQIQLWIITGSKSIIYQ